jgi:hypothetical protein
MRAELALLGHCHRRVASVRGKARALAVPFLRMPLLALKKPVPTDPTEKLT